MNNNNNIIALKKNEIDLIVKGIASERLLIEIEAYAQTERDQGITDSALQSAIRVFKLQIEDFLK
jgi:hypothetical protein